MLRFKMITFDANRTLIRVRRTVGYHYARFAEKFAAATNAGETDALDRQFGVAFSNQRKLHPNFGKNSGISSKQWWGHVLGETFRLAGIPVNDDDALTKMNEEFYEYSKTRRMWEVYPEVKEMLTFLNKNGVCLGVLSNNDERLIDVLQDLDIAYHFAFIIPSVHAAAEKPDSSLFQMALERLRLPGSECAHIGDSYERDFEGARSVGMHPFLVDRDGTLEKKYPQLRKCHVISDLTVLEKLIFQEQKDEVI